VAVADSGQVLAETPLQDIPDMTAIVGDPPGKPNRRVGDPYAAGERLFAALGGTRLLRMLESAADDLLLLACDERADRIPWEYAVTPDRRFLFFQCSILRLEPLPAPPFASDPPRLLVVCADPLLYPDGSIPAYHLDFDREIRALKQALAKSQRALVAQRVPPTRYALREALADGPAIVHISCHGALTTVADGVDVVLAFEDDCGNRQVLLGRDLIRYAPRGGLRLVVLSACQSAPLARAFVRQGVPLALGMQHNFPDPLSDDLVAAFYRYLSAGRQPSEALRQARIRLADEHPAAAGMLVGYTCDNGWAALNLPPGQPTIHLDWSTPVRLPDQVTVPTTGLLGRNAELVALATALQQGRVATIVGAGGMGKTALAATFIRRFGWRFGRVAGVSFANAPIDEGRVCRELIERLVGPQALQTIISAGDQSTDLTERLRQELCDLIEPDDLLLFDNYESILQPDAGAEAAAAAVQRLTHLLLSRGCYLLFTSRAHPTGLPDERLVPERDGIVGLNQEAAVELFMRMSSRACNGQPVETHRQIARQVATYTEGYPLAIQLLAAAYDEYEGEPHHFLERWSEYLAQAHRQGLDPRHARLASALEVSLAPLAATERRHLEQLSSLEMPFFAAAAVFLWGLPTDDDGQPTDAALADARQTLGMLVRRSLLRVAEYVTDDTGIPTDQPATYRFQPVIRQEIQRRSEHPSPPGGLVAYGVWLAKLAYGQLNRSPALVEVVWQSLPLLSAATTALSGDTRAWHIWRVATVRRHFGDLTTARTELEQALADVGDGTAVRSRLLHGLADISVVQGELERAKALYEESLAITEALKDVQGKSATLHALAYIYRVQGELERAKALYEESLAITEALKDVRGKSATLHALAYIYRVQGELERAKALYEESLAIDEALKDVRGKSATLTGIADIYLLRRQWLQAEACLREALLLAERLSDQQQIAFCTVKLGQVAQGRGDQATALARYQQGLAIFERLRMPREIQQVRALIAALDQTTPSLAEAIAAWINDPGDDQTRLQHLVALLNRIVNEVVQTVRQADRQAAEQVAETLIPLRLSLLRWPAAQALPPFNTFFGCLQALLRGEEQQLTRLRAGLDEGLAAALAEVERLCRADEAELRTAARDQQIAGLRQQVMAAMPLALADTDEHRRAQFVQQLEQVAAQAAADELPGSPWLELAAFLRACATLVRDGTVVTDGLNATDAALIAAWAAYRVAVASGDPTALAAVLPQLPPEVREQVLHVLNAQLAAHVQSLPPEQQVALVAEQTVTATRQALNTGDPQVRMTLADQVQAAADHYADGEAPDSLYMQLADLLRYCCAWLRGEPLPPVPERFRHLVSAPEEGGSPV
jgi:tetratricopeptide (TPR) repeat protein